MAKINTRGSTPEINHCAPPQISPKIIFWALWVMKKKYRKNQRYPSLKFREIWILSWVKFSDKANFQNLKWVFGEIEAPTFWKSGFYKGKKKKSSALTRQYDPLWPQLLVLWILLGQEIIFEIFGFFRKSWPSDRKSTHIFGKNTDFGKSWIPYFLWFFSILTLIHQKKW